jgi:hypothetical protein
MHYSVSSSDLNFIEDYPFPCERKYLYQQGSFKHEIQFRTETFFYGCPINLILLSF